MDVIFIESSLTTTPGSYTVTYTATDKYNSAITATTSFSLTVKPAMDVTVSSSGNIVTSPGATTGNTSTLTIAPMGGFLGTVSFQCFVSSPGNLGCAVNPSIVSIGGPNPLTATLTATAYPNASFGAYSITVEYSANASDGTFQSSTSVGVTVQGTPAIALSSGGNITVARGATTGNTSTITVTPSNGFTGAVNLSCAITNSPAGGSDPPTCSIPSSVSITGTTAATATLSVATTAPSSASLDRPLTRFVFGEGGAVLALLVFFGIPARRRPWRMLSMLAVVVLTAAVIGCSGGSSSGGSGSGSGGGSQTNPGTTPGIYTITVTGKDAATGAITASSNVTLNVN
jgi:hypothetical protein